MGGREPAAAAVHPGSERWEDTALCVSSCPFLRGCSRDPHPTCIFHIGRRGNTDEGGESAWSPASWCVQKWGQEDVGVAGSGRGHGWGRAVTEDVGGVQGQLPAGQRGWMDPHHQAGLLTLPWGSLHLAQGSSESWSPGGCLWGLTSTDSRSLFLPMPTLVRNQDGGSIVRTGKTNSPGKAINYPVCRARQLKPQFLAGPSAAWARWPQRCSPVVG